MRLATVRHGGRTYAARLEEDRVDLLEPPDLGALLASPGGWRSAAEAAPVRSVASGEAATAPLVPSPPKVICVGQNYRRHIEELGHEVPEYPTLFAKYTRALIGDGEPIELPAISSMMDWEVELVIVIGSPVREADTAGAASAIAGFTIGNDVSARDYQNRTSQWLQGKTFEHCTPVGPCLVTTDELGGEPDLALSCTVDDVLRQDSRTSDMLFKPADIVAYASQVTTLEPGDLLFTGTPAGVGHGLKPPVYLAPGQRVTTTIEGIGSLVNPCVRRAG